MDYTMENRSPLSITSNHAKNQSYCSCPPFTGWLILVQVLISARGKGLYFQPCYQSEEIYLRTSNGRWQKEGNYSQESATFDETVMSGGVCDKKREKSEDCHSPEPGQQHLRVMYDDTGWQVLPS
jgi:hypothetical protein